MYSISEYKVKGGGLCIQGKTLLSSTTTRPGFTPGNSVVGGGGVLFINQQQTKEVTQ